MFIFSWTDITASCDSDKVLSAGDNLSMLNTLPFLRNSATNLLNQHTLDIFPSFSFLVIIFSEWKPRLRKCCAFQTVQRGRLNGYPLAAWLICFPLLCLKPPCEYNMRRLPGLYFGAAAMMAPLLVSRDNFFPFAQQIFLLKSQAIRIRSTVWDSVSINQTHLHL